MALLGRLFAIAVICAGVEYNVIVRKAVCSSQTYDPSSCCGLLGVEVGDAIVDDWRGRSGAMIVNRNGRGTTWVVGMKIKKL